MELFTKNGEKKEVNITLDDILEVINFNEDYVSKMIIENQENYRYGLSFNEFVYLCLDLENPEILGNDTNKFYHFYYKFSDQIMYIEYIHILAEKGFCYTAPDFEINPRLLEKLNENINPNYSTEEKLLYYYFKLCFILSTDTLYNFVCLTFGELGEFNFKKSPNRLSKINDINNKAACFEFTAIMDKLIREAGEYAATWQYTGDRHHVNTEAVINKKLYKFDALEDPFGRNKSYRDILNIKLNNGYSGIVAGEEDFVRGINSHSTQLDKIYKDVQKEFSWFLNQRKFSKDELEKCFKNIEELNIEKNIKEKLKEYFIKFNSIPLDGIEYCLKVLGLYREKIELDTDFMVRLTAVASTIDGYDFKVIVAIATNETDYIYFMIGKNNIDVLTKTDLINLLENNKLIITKNKNKNFNALNQPFNYRTIPGINKDFQIEMNKLAETTILWDLLKEPYDDPLITDTKNKELLKTKNI